VIRSKRIKLRGHVACMGDRRGVYRISVVKTEGKNHLENPEVDGRIILRCIFKRSGMRVMDWIDLAQNRESCSALVNAVMNIPVS
jgi:hypothetical protein